MDIRVIQRAEAKVFLEKIRISSRGMVLDTATQTWKKAPKTRQTAHPRGFGGAVDYINYGGFNKNNKLVAVIRVSPTPYGNQPAKAAVGVELAPHTVYLQRLCAVGITSKELRTFVKTCVRRLRHDLRKNGHDIRYLLSLDDPSEKLIEYRNIVKQALAVTGKCYIDTGALYAGSTTKSKKATRFIKDKKLHSVYQNGASALAEAREKNYPLIKEGEKQRFVWGLDSGNLKVNEMWIESLPSNVVEPIWGVNVGYKQPRLLLQLPGMKTVFKKLWRGVKEMYVRLRRKVGVNDGYVRPNGNSMGLASSSNSPNAFTIQLLHDSRSGGRSI